MQVFVLIARSSSPKDMDPEKLQGVISKKATGMWCKWTIEEGSTRQRKESTTERATCGMVKNHPEIWSDPH